MLFYSCPQLAAPNSVIDVDVYDGSNYVTTVLAGTFRQDLYNGGLCNGDHAFYLPTPPLAQAGTGGFPTRGRDLLFRQLCGRRDARTHVGNGGVHRQGSRSRGLRAGVFPGCRLPPAWRPLRYGRRTRARLLWI